MLYRCKQDDVLDNICNAYYGHTNRVVEMVLSKNAGLADLGTHLPIGLTINLPEIEPDLHVQKNINLWD